MTASLPSGVPRQLLGQGGGGHHRHAAGSADEERLLTSEAPGHRERVGVGDLDDPVGHVAVVGLGPEVLAHTFDEVGPSAATGVDRSGRVGADHHHVGVLLLEEATGAADGAARAHAGDEVGDPALCLLPDLGPGGLVVRERVVGVGVLVGLPGPLDLAHQPVGDVVVGVGVLRGHGGRGDDHLGAVRLEDVALVLADLVRADEHALVALGLRHHRQTDPGVAGGRFHDRAARKQLAGLLGRLDHPERDPVLHRAAGVEVLHLGEHQRGVLAGGHHVVQPHQRSVADKIEQRVHVVHEQHSRRGPYHGGHGEGCCSTKAGGRRCLRRWWPFRRGRVLVRSAPGRGSARPSGHRDAEGEPPKPTGWYGHGRPGPALKVVLLGDSSAAGYGVDNVLADPRRSSRLRAGRGSGPPRLSAVGRLRGRPDT